jgi:uncharacterized protein YhaN
MKIDKVRLVGLGPFVDTEIEFGPKKSSNRANIHILTGPNGCGKSTALYALAGIFSASELPQL